jgi:single-strand DNA-binding protein
LRYTTGGRAVASFGLAVNRRYQVNGEWTEQVSFIDVSCWAQLAENVAATVEKGTRMIVSGRLEQRSWETPEGEKRSKVEVVADDIGVSLKWAQATVERNERTDAPSRTNDAAPVHEDDPF